jgi:hypothetical protein
MGSTVQANLHSLKEPFRRWCLAHAKTQSTAIRELVEAALRAERRLSAALYPQAREMAVLAAVRAVAARSPLRRCNLHLTEDEFDRLQAQAQAAGMRPAHYVAAVLLSVEAGRTAIAGKDALAALVESNYQLAWIGRSLSRLAHRGLACEVPEGGEEDLAQFRTALDELRRHLLRAASVLADVQITRKRRTVKRRRSRSPLALR